MTNDRFDMKVSAWLQADAATRLPDHLGAVLAVTSRTRQRPAWSSLERWFPMDMTLRPALGGVARSGRLMFVGLLVLALAGLLVIAVGSQRRLPEPFGLARNGLFVSSIDGDLYTVDPAAPAKAMLTDAAAFDFSPVFSRDGTTVAFLRSDGPIGDPAILSLMVVNADGTGLRSVTPPTESLDWFDWSPDGTRIAYVAAQVLYVVDVRGGEPTRMAGTGPVHFSTWLPPGGDEIVYRAETMNPAIFAIRADGTGEARALSRTRANNEFDYQAIAVSPDGSHITFTRWSATAIPRVLSLDVATGNETPLPTLPGTGQRGIASYSPDGALVAYARVYPEGGFEIVVANADGSGNERPIGPRRPGPPDGAHIPAAWTFTPDGTALIVRYGTDDLGAVSLLPLDGSPGTELGSGTFEFVDVQRLAR